MLDEFYWLNKDDPNSSLCRVTEKQGQDAHTDKLFTLSEKAQKEMIRVFLATREQMEGKRIDEVFSKDFLRSNFWLHWRTMFAFEEWHSALEMKLYLHRFIHHIGGLPDLSALKFTKYNQYESLVLPMYAWLLREGVTFEFSTEVTDIDFERTGDRIQATRIHWRRDGDDGGVDLGADDIVCATIGSLTENSDDGDHHTAAVMNTGPAPAWDPWKRIAATVTTLDRRIPAHIERICKRAPVQRKGRHRRHRDRPRFRLVVELDGVNRQPHFKAQGDGEIVVWLHGLFAGTPGDYACARPCRSALARRSPRSGCTTSAYRPMRSVCSPRPAPRVCPSSCRMSMPSSCRVGLVIDQTSSPPVRSTSRSSGSSPRPLVTASSPPSTRCAPAWRPPISCWGSTAASRRCSTPPTTSLSCSRPRRVCATAPPSTSRAPTSSPGGSSIGSTPDALA